MTTRATIYYTIWESPLQLIIMTSDGEALTGLYLSEQAQAEIKRQAENTSQAAAQNALQPSSPNSAHWIRSDEAAPFADVKRQLTAYFEGRQTTFDVPLKPEGTPFQQQVWEELRRIPFGATISYGELARRIGNPNASRAVGLANGRNPVSILVPCHRVIGANGKLTGYSGGLSRKETLLTLERRILENLSAPK